MPDNLQQHIGILGGTFNPIHIGHLVLAQRALEHFDLARIIFVPCAAPPHKSSTNVISGRHRMAMIESAIGWNPSFEVSNIELLRTGFSYAIDTVRALRGQYPRASFSFLIGADSLLELHKWRQIDELLEMCRFISFSRPGFDVETIQPTDIPLPPPWPERLLSDLALGLHLDVSSTDIRYRIAEGLSIRYLVPPEVEMYIAEHGLYES